jgi:hypothetical protein
MGPLRDTDALAEGDGYGEEVGMVESICRVCGLDEDDERWTGPDGAQYVICSCCGAESGVDDLDLRWVREYRSKWIATGCTWFTPERRPTDWEPDRQMSGLPVAWR